MKIALILGPAVRTLGFVLCLYMLPLAVIADTPLRPEIRAVLVDAKYTGSARLSIWGFEIYQANLWTVGGFSAQDYSQHAFALELEYLRNFSSDAIAKRSIQEMQRVGGFSVTQADQWQAQLRTLIPDVKKGDRITGINRPGLGAGFFVNGQATGEVSNAEFSRLFFGIWLSPKTSEPQLRQSLLGQITP
jgi:Chalcone isomerase-like